MLPEDGADTHYDRLTAKENLEYFGRLYDVPQESLQDRIAELLEFLEMSERSDDSPAGFSTGLKQKLSIARALIHNPLVVFLDEPTSSLDPIMSKKVRQFIDKMSETWKQTFFICTHLLSEAELFCDRVAFISHGQLVEVGRPQDLRRKFWTERTFELSLANSDPIQGREAIKATGLALTVRVEGSKVVYVVRDANEKNPQIIRGLVEAGLHIVELREHVPSLEDVYFRVIGGK